MLFTIFKANLAAIWVLASAVDTFILLLMNRLDQLTLWLGKLGTTVGSGGKVRPAMGIYKSCQSSK